MVADDIALGNTPSTHAPDAKYIIDSIEMTSLPPATAQEAILLLKGGDGAALETIVERAKKMWNADNGAYKPLIFGYIARVIEPALKKDDIANSYRKAVLGEIYSNVYQGPSPLHVSGAYDKAVVMNDARTYKNIKF